MALAAQDHCSDIATSRITGHVGTDGSQVWDRISRYGKWHESVAENIAFGTDNGPEKMIQLYIDDGLPTKGHRQNIVSPAFTLTGIAFCNHDEF